MNQEPDQLDRGIGYNMDFTKSYALLRYGVTTEEIGTAYLEKNINNLERNYSEEYEGYLKQKELIILDHKFRETVASNKHHSSKLNNNLIG